MRRITLFIVVQLVFATFTMQFSGAEEVNIGDCVKIGVFTKDKIPKSLIACTNLIKDSRQPPATIARAYFNRGTAYYGRSKAGKGRELRPGVLLKTDADMRQARSDFNEAIRLDPTQFWYYRELAETYDMLNDYGPPVEILTRAMSADPRLAYEFRASAHIAAGNRSAAIADLNELLKRDPTDTGALRTRASVYMEEKNYEAAIADFNVATKRDPEYAHGYQERGRAYAEMGDHKRAIQDYDEAARLPGMIETGLLYYYRAESYERLNDYGAAILDYERAIRIDPDFGAAKIALSNVRKKLGFKR